MQEEKKLSGMESLLKMVGAEVTIEGITITISLESRRE